MIRTRWTRFAPLYTALFSCLCWSGRTLSSTNYCKIIKETADPDNNIEIGRIYSGNVFYDENNEIISLKATIDNFNYEISKPNLYGSVDTLFGE